LGEPIVGYGPTMSNAVAATRNVDTPDTGTNGTDEIKSVVAGLSQETTREILSILQSRLVATLDLQLTLKHVHWNVVGMNFIAIHEMLDPQVDAVRVQSDEIAERIATLGGEPRGTPGAIVDGRSWDDYDIDRAPTVQHLVALDKVYSGVIADHRAAVARFGELDPVSEDLLIGHLRALELFQWFVRSHLQDATGDVVHRTTYTKS